MLGAGGPLRNTGSGELWQAAGPVWAECWAHLIVSDGASGRLRGTPFIGSSPGGNRWYRKQPVRGLAAGTCSEPLLPLHLALLLPPHSPWGGVTVCLSCSCFCCLHRALGSLHEDRFSLGYMILAFSHGNAQGHNPTRRKTAQKLKQQLASHE